MTLNSYSVFRVTARASFTAFTLLACSSGPTPTTVPLETVALQHNACKRLSGPRATPVVYRCQTDGATVFATTLKDCSIPEKFTFQTTTRQLFVGLLDLKVVSQSPVQFGAMRALQTVATGVLDAEPVLVSTCTFRKHDCVTDIVLWRGADGTHPTTESVTAFTASASHLTSLLLDGALSLPHGEDATS